MEWREWKDGNHYARVEGLSVEYYYHTMKRTDVSVWFCQEDSCLYFFRDGKLEKVCKCNNFTFYEYEEPMKPLVNEIRDMVREARTRGMYPVVTDAASDMLGRSCWSEEDEAELFTKIAERIEREHMPLPILEGEPLKVGDKVDGYNQEGAKVEAVMNDKMVVVRSTVKGVGGYHDEAYPLLLWSVDDLKRHVNEVLDADGVPITVGDVVYFAENEEPFDVLGIESDGDEPVHIGRNDRTSTDAWVSPGDLTHEQPDTLERIEEDAKKKLWHYWVCSGARCAECPALIDGKTPKDHYHTDYCEEAKVLDLLRRQRELLERGQA